MLVNSEWSQARGRNLPLWVGLAGALAFSLACGCGRERMGAAKLEGAARVPVVARPAGRLPREDIPSQSPREPEAARQLERVERLLDGLRSGPIPLGQGHWVRAHWILVYGGSGYSQFSKHDKFNTLLKSLVRADPNQLEPPFVIRAGKPMGRQEGPGLNRQFHNDQFLAYLALSGVPLSQPLEVERRDFRVSDLLAQSLDQVHLDGELSWTILAYTQYLDPETTWRNKFGEEMTVARLVRALLDHEEDACGGAHQNHALSQVFINKSWGRSSRLIALRQEIRDRLEHQVELVKMKPRARCDVPVDNPLPEAIRTADEAVSTVYYEGHALEWLSAFLPEDDQRSPWIMTMVAALSDAIRVEQGRLRDDEVSKNAAWRWSDLGHAAAGLSRWVERVKPKSVQDP